MDNHKKKKNNKYIWVSLIVIILALIIAAIAVLPQFYIENINVSGVRKLDSNNIIAVTGVKKGNHLFSYISGSPEQILGFRYGKIENKLKEENAYIDDVKVRVKYPYTVDINIKERVEVAYINSNSEYLAIDKAGKILDVLSEKPVNAAAPIITGLNLNSHTLGENVSVETMRHVKRCLMVMNIILETDKNSTDDYKLADQVLAYRSYQSNSLYLTVKDMQGKSLNVLINPSEEPQQAIAWLRKTIQKNVLDDLGEGVLSISKSQKVFNKNSRLPKPIEELLMPETTQEHISTEGSSEASTTSSSGVTENTSTTVIEKEEPVNSEESNSEDNNSEESNSEEYNSEESNSEDYNFEEN